MITVGISGERAPATRLCAPAFLLLPSSASNRRAADRRRDLGLFGRQRFLECFNDGLDQALRDPIALPQRGHFHG